MKNFIERHMWIRIVFGAILLALGVVTICVALAGDASDLNKIACIMLSVYCLLLGAFGLFVSVFADIKERSAVLTGAILMFGAVIGVGVVLLIKLSDFAGVVGTIVAYCVPWVLIGAGSVAGLKFILALCFRESRRNVKAWVVSLLAATLFLTVGIILWLNISDVGPVVYTIIGIIVVLVAVVIITFGIVALVKVHKAKKTIKKDMQAIENK